MVQTISSRKNPVIREAERLSRLGEAREAQQLFVAEGARLCEDAANSGIEIQRLFFTSTALEKYQKYLAPLQDRAAESYCIKEHVAELLSQTKHTQGVFCQCRMPQRAKQRFDQYLVLEDLQDPANLGAVLRTAEALGGLGVVLLGHRQDPYAPKVLRSAMGAVFRLSIERYREQESFFRWLSKSGLRSYGAVAGGAAKKLGKLSLPRRCAVLVGNEGNGLRPETIARCDELLTIPMKGRGESLNAAAAAAILMWEMLRSPDRASGGIVDESGSLF